MGNTAELAATFNELQAIIANATAKLWERFAKWSRAEMIEAGALGEAATLAARGLDPDLPAMKAAGFPELWGYLRGEIALAAAIAAGQRATRRYAKRQMTWFRHQTVPDLTVAEQFSQDLLRSSLRFVRESVLTA